MSSDDKPSQLHYSPEKIAESLEFTNWSSGFSWEQVKRLSNYFKIYGAEKGQVLFRQGTVDSCLGILLKGQLQVVRVGKGKKTLLATVRPPQTFGELSLIDGQARSAHILASSDAEYLLLSKENLDRMADQFPQIAYMLLMKISYIMSQRLRNTSGQLTEIIDVSKPAK